MKSNILKNIKKSYIAIILLIIYIPLIFLVIWSFAKESPKGNIVPNPDSWGFGNYLKLFTDNQFLNSLLNTFIIVCFVVPISLTIAVITCYGVWNNKKSVEKTNDFVSKISLVNPEIITGISLSLLFSSTWIAIGLDLGFFTIILSHISFCTPYAIITIYPRMQKFNKNLVDASRDLGYGHFKTFFKIVIPYLLPSILGAAGIVAIMSFDDFIITNLVRGRVTTVSTEIYLMSKGIKAWAVSLGGLLVILFIFFIAIKALIGYKKNKKQKQIELSNVLKQKGRTIWKK